MAENRLGDRPRDLRGIPRYSDPRIVREPQPDPREIRKQFERDRGGPRGSPNIRGGLPRGGPGSGGRATPLGGPGRRLTSFDPSAGGLSQMLAEHGAPKSIVKAAKEIEGTKGGPELLYSYVVEQMMEAQGIPSKDTKKVRLYCIGGYVEAARGGSTKAAAERARRAGSDGDEMLVHMTPSEFEVIKGIWGDPDTNPDTGLPEYGFLKKAWKKIKGGVKKVFKSPVFKTLAPIALSVFAPGLGTAVGGALGLTGSAASVAGNALIRGGLGALTGGKEGLIRGAVSGAVAGGLGDIVGSKLGLTGKTAGVVGSALLGGAGSTVAGQGFLPGAVTGGLETFMGTRPEQMAEGLSHTYTGLAPGQAGPPLPIGKGIMNVAKKYGLPALGIAAASGFLSGEGDYAEGPPPGFGQSRDSNFGESLPSVSPMNREFQGLPSAEDYFTYGQPGAAYSGQHLFLPPEPFPLSDGAGAPVGGSTGLGPMGQLTEQQLRDTLQGQRFPYFQRGGEVDHWAQNADVFQSTPTVSREGGRHVRGPGSGRSDDIPARLSDGEYVIDAESVALLGDGSGNAGAERLDEMRRNLRKHKAKNLGKGKFSHKAKTPDQYMGQLRQRTSTYKHGGAHA